MSRPVITRVLGRMLGVVAPGSGRHRLHDKVNELEAMYIFESDRADKLNDQVRKLQEELKAARTADSPTPGRGLTPPGIPHADTGNTARPRLVIPVIKTPAGDDPTIPIRTLDTAPNGFVVRTLGGKPLLASIPQQKMRE